MKKSYLPDSVFTHRRLLVSTWLLSLLLLFSVTLRAADIKLEAENATLNGVGVATTFTGYTGSGYAWGIDDDTDNVVFTFPATAGQYELTINYTSPYGEKGYDLLVNSTSSNGMFTQTGESFAAAKAGTFQLLEGQNTIRIGRGWGYFGIDNIVLKRIIPNVIKLEAENATLNGVDVATSFSGYSGSGYAWGIDNDTDNITFNFDGYPGQYELTINYTSPYGEKGFDLSVNSVNSNGMFKATGEAFDSLKVGTFPLLAGQNTIRIGRGWGYFGIDNIVLKRVVPSTIQLEAEAATLTGVEVATSPTGFSGTGYAWAFDNANDKVTFSFDGAAGEYELTIGYYAPYGDKGYGLQVNGATSEGMFANTGQAFGTVKVGKFQLVDGENTVTITNGWGYYGLDYLSFSRASQEPPVEPPLVLVPVVDGKAEAEKAVLTGVQVATSPAGFSGTGYVSEIDASTDKITFNFTSTAGLYEISVGYTSPNGEKGFDMSVNGEAAGGIFPLTPGFGVMKGGKFLLKEGVNTVVIGRGWGYFGIDYILMTPTSTPLPTKPSKLLTDAKATPATRALFSYLVDQYGSKVLSGQQDDVNYILEKTGKEPAIGNFDLIEYSPSRVENGSNPTGTSERYLAWAQKEEGNGILSLLWHWNAPTDLINQAPDKLWWRGFYTDATTFDIAAVLADKSGSRYQLLLRDIDVIAAELKKFQDANVPVLWRPLHEAPGGWFWWGAKGPGPFKELWHILYERLTNYHNLHNLIWVYTGTPNLDWYPGDAYVDVVGLDIYTDASANMSGDWTNIQEKFDGKKLVTLSETGNLPVPDKIRGYGTWWSWFSVWTGNDYIKKQPLDLLRAVYNDEDVITRDELPNWRVYGSPTVAITAPATNASFLVCQTPVFTAEASDAEGSVTKVTFRANGNVLGVDSTALDGWKFSWTNAPAGTYIVTAEATDNDGLTKLSAPSTILIKADDQAPVVTAPADMTVSSNPILCFASVNVGMATATDNCAVDSLRGIRSDKCALNKPYPLGTTIITWIAKDKAGNTSQATQRILVKDTNKPVVLVSPISLVLWSPNHQYQTVRVRDFVLSALDNCSGIIKPASIRITKVSSDEAEKAPNSGNTSQDVVIQADCQSVQLRAERVENGNGRVYTIQVEASDAAGNIGTATYQVLVPVGKNQSAKADAAAYTVTSACGTVAARTDLAEASTEAAIEEVAVYPNPVSDNSLHVSVYSATSQAATFALVNVTSQEAISVKKNLAVGMNQVTLSVEKVTNGIYVLVVTKGNQRITRKVVISK